MSLPGSFLTDRSANDFVPSSLRAAADVDHVAVAGAGVGIDEAGDQHTAIEGDDLAVIRTARRARRPDIVLAAAAALDAQLLRGGLVGEMHHHAAALAGADHIRLL